MCLYVFTYAKGVLKNGCRTLIFFFFFFFFVLGQQSILQEVNTSVLIYKYADSQIIHFVFECMLRCSSLYVCLILSKGRVR